MKIRPFQDEDREGIVLLYQRAFAGFPWYQSLTIETLRERFAKDQSRPGFQCLVADIDCRVAGACWWDETSVELLRAERGEELARFLEERPGYAGEKAVWFRDTMVDPDFMRQGIAKGLKKDAFGIIQKDGVQFVFTRFRNDNAPIIAVNQRFGMVPTGITVMIHMSTGGVTDGAYWYLDLRK